MRQIRVMIVDDSPLFLTSARRAMEEDSRICVVATASDGRDALEKVPSVKPDVIICDILMPRMDGIDFLKVLLPRYKIPVLVISRNPKTTLAALANGAVDFIAKPSNGEPNDAFFKRMIKAVHVAAQSNVKAKSALHKPVKAPKPPLLAHSPEDVVVAIGASTGGTDAILEVVRELPPNFPAVLITQHMPAGFTTMYAQRLNRECKMQVREVVHGDRVQRGLILLAAGDYHMRLRRDSKGLYVTSQTGEKVNGHMPSVSVLFDSVAQVAGERAVGIILTGMGSDGTMGLLHMRRAGAYTIGQNKETSVVYGMPMVAYNAGAVVKQLPLEEIADELVRHVDKM